MGRPAKKTEKVIPKKNVKKAKSASATSTPAKPEKKKARRKKDPNAPKRAVSAFMFFSNDIRDQVRKEKPGNVFCVFSLL